MTTKEISDYQRSYREAHQAEIIEYRRSYYEANRQKLANSYRFRLYGLTPEAFDELFLAQGSACGICGCTEPPPKKNWCIDHDHRTGEVRGILCSNCNSGLAFFRDRRSSLERAIEYLGRPNE